MMRLNDILTVFQTPKVIGDSNILFNRLKDDSRKVEQGDLFIAVKGYATDGHQFIEKAIANGASAIIAEVEQKDCLIPQIIISNTQEVLSKLSLFVLGNPEKKLKLIGVTGTNGKTTTTTLIYQMMIGLGYKVALIGTNSKIVSGKVTASKLTTPGAIELANDIKEIFEEGCEYLVMEASSHALKQYRLHALHFDVAIFTNLTRDHLDYHETFEDYANSKQMLFNKLTSSSLAIINHDDDYGRFMAEQSHAQIKHISLEKNADYRILENTNEGLKLQIHGNTVESKLSGSFNAYNLIQAIEAVSHFHKNEHEVFEIAKDINGAEGRLEKIQIDQSPTVYVDYAHTPDALKNVAETLSHIKNELQKLHIVFGCGGDRDRGKRPEMATIAEQFGDQIIITSDNPRFEDPEKILDEVETGFSNKTHFKRIENRAEAIQSAIMQAESNDMILIAGKGHETYQEIKGVRYDFDDRVIAYQALQKVYQKEQEEM